MTDELDRLRATYGHGLVHKVRRLARAVHGATRRPDDQVAGGEARALTHQLKGSGGSFGFTRVSELAARLEPALAGISARKSDERGRALQEADQALAELSRAAEQAGLPGLWASGSRRVLVVDSSAEFVDRAVAAARRSLVEVVPAESLAVALEKMKESSIDAAILDANLAGGAASAARELRALHHERLPLAFVSAEGSVKSRLAAAEAGAMLFLCRPVEEESFGLALRQLVGAPSVPGRHVLLLDNEVDGALVAAILRGRGLRVTTLSGPLDLLEELARLRPDLLLLDVNLPGVSGFDLCRMLRTTARWQDLPVVFLTARGDAESRLAGFQAQGDDYLAKPMNEDELAARVQLHLDRARHNGERADHDPLTGLLVRRAFSEGLAARLQEARRARAPLTLCLLDLDHFQQVNDVHGHLSGDRVLARLGSLLGSRLRLEDLSGRWGGEEFVVALPGQNTDAARQVVERLLAEFRGHAFGGESRVGFRTSFSGGLATWPDDGESFDALLRTADWRLHEAKHSGRAAVVGEDRPGKSA